CHDASDPSAYILDHSRSNKISQWRARILWRSRRGAEVYRQTETACAVSRGTCIRFLFDKPTQLHFDLCPGHVFPRRGSVGDFHHTLVHQPDRADTYTVLHSRISESNYKRSFQVYSAAGRC